MVYIYIMLVTIARHITILESGKSIAPSWQP